jgi:hypothetical protein
VCAAQFTGVAEMQTLILAIWPLSLLLTFVGLVTFHEPAKQTGEIVAEQASFCDFFIVKVEDRFVFLWNEDRWFSLISSANRVTGNLLTKGVQDVDVDGRARLNVRVLGWDTDWPRARTRFDSECDPSAPVEDLLGENLPGSRLVLR